MKEYMKKLKQQLLFEGSCVTSRCGLGGGVYEYIQREFAYNECKMDGGELSEILQVCLRAVLYMRPRTK